MIAISGAGGRLGHLVTDEVLARTDPGRVRLLSRNPERLTGLPAGVETRAVDLDDPASIGDALDGVAELLLISTGSIDRRAAQHAAAIDAAVAAGVRRIVYTSMISPGVENPAIIAPSHRETEERIVASGLEFTILRCGFYSEFQVFEALQAIETGRLAHGRDDGRCAYVARTDLATAAAVVLLSATEDGRTIDLTGPEALGAAELAALYERIGGAPVVNEPLDADAFAAALGGPDDDGHLQYGAALALSIDAAIGLGLHEAVTDDVARLIGRPPVRVVDVLEGAADELRAVAAARRVD